MKYFGRINNAKGKHPTLGKFYLFSFCTWKRQSWWMHWNVGLNPYSFSMLFSNSFSNWIYFEYGGNMYTWLYIANYLSAIYIYIFAIYYIPYAYTICFYIIPLSMLWSCRTCIELTSWVLLAADIEQLTVN